METMKRIARVVTFAAVFAVHAMTQTQTPAQPKDPATELAAVVAVEEQERDLGKAETLYRELLAGTKLSPGARVLANSRLAGLLERLGRQQEAAPFRKAAEESTAGFDDFGPAPVTQDPAREAALRQKAREVVKLVMDGKASGTTGVAVQRGAAGSEKIVREAPAPSPLYLIRDDVAQQLLWLGQAAVPAAIEALDAAIQSDRSAESRWLSPVHCTDVVGLIGFLWRVGGPQAAEFVASGAKQPLAAWRRLFVAAAFQATRPEMLTAAQAYFADPNDEVFAVLLANGSYSMVGRYDTQALIAAARKVGTARMAALLREVNRANPLTDPMSRFLPLVREALGSDDPQLGSLAQQVLLGSFGGSSIEALELLLGELPKFDGRVGLRVPSLISWGRSRQDAARILPQIAACATALHRRGGPLDNDTRKWFLQVLQHFSPQFAPEDMPHLIALADAGFFASGWLLDKVTPENLRDVFACWERCAPQDVSNLCSVLSSHELPADLFPRLAAMVEKAESGNPEPMSVVQAIVRTGHPAAVDWLVAHYRKESFSDFANALIELGKRTPAEKVLAAMQRLMADAGSYTPGLYPRLVLARLALHDRSALGVVAEIHLRVPNDGMTRVPHPYATGKPEESLTTPLIYLVETGPNPPHGFSEDDVLGVLRKIAEKGLPERLYPPYWDIGRVPDRIVAELARFEAKTRPSQMASTSGTWVGVLAGRLAERAEKGEALGALGEWFPQMLASDDAAVLVRVIARIPERLVAPLVPRLEALLDHDESEVAKRAAEILEQHAGHTGFDWCKRLVGSRHTDLRRVGLDGLLRLGTPEAERLVATLATDADPNLRTDVAAHFGARLDKDAVPALLTLLRDPIESVRVAATESLTRIRFYHEQQAHWDRVLKGLDASPATAAEKLLLQAKAGAPRAQRLLAVRSLGVLGAPEALPFLIEWTQDADAELAAAATAAVLQIHQNPRR